jgi:ketol-acid reductoisomerase
MCNDTRHASQEIVQVKRRVWNIIRSAINSGDRVKRFHVISPIDGTRMWQVGMVVCASRRKQIPVDPFTAGISSAMKIAQIDVFLSRDNFLSEIVIQSGIEPVGRFSPYLHACGVAYLVSICSSPPLPAATSGLPAMLST